MSTIYQEFTYGDIASLRGNSSLVVTSPSGIATRFPASVHRVQRFRVEELGTWLYEWEDGVTGEFVVVSDQSQSRDVLSLPPPPPPPTPGGENIGRPIHTHILSEKFFAFL